jgi:hypothetical protein
LHRLTCRKRRLLQTEDPENDTLMNPDQFFFQLWEGVAELAGDVESPDSLAQHYGQVHTLPCVVAYNLQLVHLAAQSKGPKVAPCARPRP